MSITRWSNLKGFWQLVSAALAAVACTREGWFRAGHRDLNIHLEISLGIRYTLTCHSARHTFTTQVL